MSVAESGSITGHEFNWPYGYVCRYPVWDWNQLVLWLEQHVGAEHQDWAVGRFEIVFQQQSHCLLFTLTWG